MNAQIFSMQILRTCRSSVLWTHPRGLACFAEVTCLFCAHNGREMTALIGMPVMPCVGYGKTESPRRMINGCGADVETWVILSPEWVATSEMARIHYLILCLCSFSIAGLSKVFKALSAVYVAEFQKHYSYHDMKLLESS